MKRNILKKLSMEGLAGSAFEREIEVKNLKAGDEIVVYSFCIEGAVYILEGAVCQTIFTEEGREVYRYHRDDSVIGVSKSLSLAPGAQDHFGSYFIAEEDSVVAFLPLSKITDASYTPLLLSIMAKEASADSIYNVSRLAYSDEEFFIKALESSGGFELNTSELSRALNIKIRSLQRLIKKYLEAGLITKENSRICIKDKRRFEEFKNKTFRI